jgi:integrase
MTITVYLIKRYLRGRKRNGQRVYVWVLRWSDPSMGLLRCESTGTADKTSAEALCKKKWAELNGLITPPAPIVEEAPAPAKATWNDCREAMRRAMNADNLRPSYVADAVLTLDSVHRMFPTATSPADVTAEMGNEYKRRRSEGGASPWTVHGDLAALKAVFGKWLGKECGLLDPTANPFANVKPPRCDEPEKRIVTAAESAELFAWLAERWNGWRLPAVYLEAATLLGWRATELASMRADDVLADGFVRVRAETCKTRRVKHGWLPAALHAELRSCAADGWAFGRFASDLARLLTLWKRRPHHAARVRDFMPKRLVGWLQDELKRFNESKAAKAKKAETTWEAFTLHDFRRTAITG